ncbi:NFACT family protein [Paenisporosarcina quisquiliarum]|uniref:Rqc2 homolog RqcH n=1 Tax=Paenisporosarcina quisquiliarum TaxID=365346 RepID=A0A9X3LFU7_9BACL|nr:NFACT RNA binding domain-containing protein [Paenisporosarcina quisquiliarum]MCZ8535584.1 NFACT family protein [Paenisporosarcina quisquiliarum]
MAFDGLFTKAMTNELQQLVSGRISKIHQPNSQEIVLHIRAAGKNSRLLISIHPSYSRIHITNEAIDNPSEPPMFCMLLRKHLEGGFISSITQLEMDRVIILRVESKNEIGDDMVRELHIEIMGRHSNVILIDPVRNLILDSLKHLSPSVNSYRTILPGQPHIAPPKQDKVNPYEVDEASLSALLETDDVSKTILSQLAGFSPLQANELAYRLTDNNQDKFEVYRTFLEEFNHSRPTGTYVETGNKAIFSSNKLVHIDGETIQFESLGLLLDKVYFARAERDRVKQQAGDLERWLQNELDKLKLKMKKLAKEKANAEKLETFQLHGELLMANLYTLEKGMTEAQVVNYYDEENTVITIPLSPRKTPVENAQSFYTRYNKAKTALLKTQQQMDKTKDDIDYLEMLQQQVLQASPQDIEEIREELAEQGWMKARISKKKKKVVKPTPENFVSSKGLPISVGKNNKQNDYLTFKIANKSQTWFHTKDIPGSHVVIHDNDPDETSILEAAGLAAYFSKARDSSSVPVDYTEVRHVKKPNGSKPGFVIYFEQKTVFVTPSEDLVRKLRK